MAPEITYPGVYVEELPGDVRVITGVPTGIAAFIGAAKRGPVGKAVRVTGFAEFERVFGGLLAGAELGYAVRQFFLNGGTEAFVVRVARRATEAQTVKGIRALDRVALVNLLALPGVTAAGILARAADYCRERHAFLLIDAPGSATTPAEMAQFIRSGSLPASSHAAIYFPWTTVADPLHGGQPRATPPSGSIAGLIARTDRTAGVWKAPAGTTATLTGVAGLAAHVSDSDLALLTPLAVNCLRILPTGAIVAWGARTLEGRDGFPSDWRYLPVRRLALCLEERIRRATQWVVFEPNGEPLWAKIRSNVGAVLDEFFRAGAFQGSRPKDAYFVRCDAQTMTAADIAAGSIIIAVGFAPLKPAEFVVLTIRQQSATTP